MAVARKILVGLAWLYVLLVAVQFFIAGLMLLGTESADTLADYRDIHEGLGYAVLHLSPILMLIVAAIGRVGRNLLILIFVFAVIVFVQPIWVAEFSGEFLGSLHVIGALVIAALAHEIAQRATRLLRAEPAGAVAA